MNCGFGLDLKQSFLEMFELQKKMLKGMEIMINMKEIETDATPKTLIYQEDKMKLYHYHPLVKNPAPIPVLITYALVNKQYMMDIQPDRSVIKTLLELGLDVYIIDWGYPTAEDRYLTMDDYINGYMDSAVEYILSFAGIRHLNLLGVCQGGTFSAIYASLHPEKVKNLITMVAPIDFSTNDGLLFHWSRNLNIDSMVDAYGVIPGSIMNVSYLMLKPFALLLDKYVGILENMDAPEVVENFVRMEKWIFDSPDQVGETLREFVKDLYQENKLVKGELVIGGKKVDLKNITMPLLNVYAEHDHLVPPASSIPLNNLVSSADKQLASFPVGHIGLYVSSRSQKEIAPQIANWIFQRSN